MMIFAYDHHGIIMTDRVPCGRSVTGLYYRDFIQNLNRKMHKTRPQLLKAGPLIPVSYTHLCTVNYSITHRVYTIKHFPRLCVI